MFETANILHINKYIFPDGSIKKTGKFLIVLYNENNVSIIATLASSQDHIPDEFGNKRCISEQEKNIACYKFPKNAIICENGFCFHKNTFIYFSKNIFRENIELIKSRYNQDAITLMGKLTNDEFKELIYCAYRSKTYISRGIVRIFETILETIC